MSLRKFGITTNLSGLDQGLLVNSISFNENPQVAQARDEKGKLIDLATYSTEKNVTINGLYLDDMLSCGSYINIGFDQYLITSKAKRETNTGFQTGTINAQRVSANISPTVIFDIPNIIMWDFQNSSTSSMNFANYVSAIPDCTEINYDLEDILYDNLPSGIVFNNGILSANKDLMSGDYNSVLSLNVSAYFQSGVIIQESSPYFTFTIQNVTTPVHTPLSFKAVNSSGAVQLTKSGSPSAIVLDYKVNNGSWTPYNIGDTINLNQNDIVYLSGANDHFSKNQPNRYSFLFVGDVQASGNIQSLLNFSDNAPSCCFIDLFNNCTNLLTTPDLPATILNHSCYYQMFKGCSSLVTPPIISASTLANDCCYAMFSGCTSLLSAPALPATQLFSYCYMNMFRDCISLSTVPHNMLPAKSLAPYCYCAMFAGCTRIKKLPYDLLYAGESLREGCYSGMFAGCTALTASPQLLAETLVERCYSGMFKGCSKLQIIYAEFRDWKYNLYGENLPTWQWVDGVAESGDFHKYFFLPDRFGISFIPSRWTVY